jgi:hypothetical protein
MSGRKKKLIRDDETYIQEPLEYDGETVYDEELENRFLSIAKEAKDIDDIQALYYILHNIKEKYSYLGICSKMELSDLCDYINFIVKEYKEQQ